MADDGPPEAVPLEQAAEPDEAGRDEKGPVPVTLITGFLGAGKTTLVRHILEGNHGLRIAVILNEVGEGVEGAYFQDIQGLRDSAGDWVELDNGCMCCSVKSDFVKALESLLAKERQPDYILIETTGLANPGPVAAALWTDDEIEAGVQLDSIITVVDAINIDRQLHDTRSEGAVNEAQVQIAYADLILLNKMDLAGDEAIDRAEADIRAINSTVHIMKTTRSSVDIALLLNRHGYKHGAEITLPAIAEDEDEDGPAPLATAHGAQSASRLTGAASMGRSSLGGLLSHSRAVSLKLDDHLTSSDLDDEGHAGHIHDSLINTVMLRSSQPLSLEKVKSFLDKLLWDRDTHPEDIYRVKGVLSLEGDDRKHMVQAVYELYNISPSASWGPGEARVSRVVVIGRNLKKDVLEKWFAENSA